MSFGEFFENLEDSATSAFSNWAGAQIDGALGNSGFIEVGQAPTSNTTAKEAMSGVKGQAPTSIANRIDNNVVNNGFGFGKIGTMVQDNMMIVGGGLLVILAIFFRGRK